MLDKLRAAVDKATREHLTESKRRSHLGASSIGAPCVRQAWYGFRWAYEENHTGRIRRLFDRGHEEEYRVLRWLRATGFEVQDHSERLVLRDDLEGREWYNRVPWDSPLKVDEEDVSENAAHLRLAHEQGAAPAQWSFTDHGGHYAGSSDGKIRGLEAFGLKGWGGLEIKTHGDKSFKLLKKKAVVSSKPVHYVQVQTYMHYFQLPWCLYVAVNKNDDEIYYEVIYYKREVALNYCDRAAGVISAVSAPPRITEDPSWFECRFCAFREVCHYDETPQKNCRSCAYAEPVDGGKWHCGLYDREIPDDFIPLGCDRWKEIK